MNIPILGTLAASGIRGIVAIVKFKVERIGIPQSRKDEYTLKYSTEKDALVGKVGFLSTPIPIASISEDGSVTRKSPYYGNIITAVLSWLNQYASDYTDPDGNRFYKLNWEAKDIFGVTMESETFGVVTLEKKDAAVYAENLKTATAWRKQTPIRGK